MVIRRRHVIIYIISGRNKYLCVPHILSTFFLLGEHFTIKIKLYELNMFFPPPVELITFKHIRGTQELFVE